MFASVGEAARRALETEMDLSKYEFQTPFGRKFYGAGRADGRTEGILLGRAQSIIAVLAARGIRCTNRDRKRIESCQDLSQLETWLERAAVANTIVDVFS